MVKEHILTNKLFSKYISKEYPIDYRLDKKIILGLIEIGELKTTYINGQEYIYIPSLEAYIEKMNNIKKDYISFKDFLLILKKDPYSCLKIYPPVERISIFKEWASVVGLKLKILPYPFMTPIQIVYIHKQTFEIFLQEFIFVDEARAELSISYNTFMKYINKFEFPISSIPKSSLKFMKKEDFLYLKNLFDVKNTTDFIETNKVRQEFNIGLKALKKVFEEYNIIPELIKKRSYIKTSDFEYLKKEYKRLHAEIDWENCYTYSEIALQCERLNLNNLTDKVIIKSLIKELPLLLRGFTKGNSKSARTIYDKKVVDEHLKSSVKNKKIQDLFDTITPDDYNLIFEKITEIEGIHFSKNALLTKELWIQFVKWKLKNSNHSQANLKRQTQYFVIQTNILTEVTQAKDLMGFSEKELNLSIFNDNVSIHHQKEIYNFINNINQMLEVQKGKKIWDTSQIEFDSRATKTGRITDKSIYSIDEYINLYLYAKNFKLHKKLAIENLKIVQASNIYAYNSYDSTWLFILLHINNSWRKGTVESFPIYYTPLYEKLNIVSIESLESLELTQEEAEQIVKFYQYQYYQHHKTKQEAVLYCSSILIIPMAYAILICEFRYRNFNKVLLEKNNLINFCNEFNKIRTKHLNTYFKNFGKKFYFKSLTMNRTVSTLSNEAAKLVLKQEDIIDSIAIAQHLRGHGSPEVTNIYTIIPQEHLDFIVEQVFDKGYFGFVYEKINQLILNIPPKDKKVEPVSNLKALLGDVAKLEDTTSFLNYMSQQKKDIEHFLTEVIPKNELITRLNLINLGLSPAKNETYQCLFADCIANEIDCNNCPFAIYYDLSIPIGEKTKLYNILCRDYQSILEAEKKFGKEIIEMLINSEIRSFEENLFELPEPDDLIT